MYNDIYNKEQYAYLYGTLLKWLHLKTTGKNMESFFDDHGVSRIAIYGVSGLGELLYEELRSGGIEVCFFVDKKHKEYIYGYSKLPVIGIDQIKEKLGAFDAIVVTPVFYFNEISDALYKAGVPYENILSLSMIVS
jgi:UDP-N-acetylmuramoylalanine-D-glutamate ligase